MSAVCSEHQKVGGRGEALDRCYDMPRLNVTFVGLGPLGLHYILKAGGSGYFRMNVVRRYLKSGRLRLVAGATEFPYPAYAVYSENADAQIVTPALVGLRHVAGSDTHEQPGQAGATSRRRAAPKPRRIDSS
jgi:hypothetical protein